MKHLSTNQIGARFVIALLNLKDIKTPRYQRIFQYRTWIEFTYLISRRKLKPRVRRPSGPTKNDHRRPESPSQMLAMRRAESFLALFHNQVRPRRTEHPWYLRPIYSFRIMEAIELEFDVNRWYQFAKTEVLVR